MKIKRSLLAILLAANSFNGNSLPIQNKILEENIPQITIKSENNGFSKPNKEQEKEAIDKLRRSNKEYALQILEEIKNNNREDYLVEKESRQNEQVIRVSLSYSSTEKSFISKIERAEEKGFFMGSKSVLIEWVDKPNLEYGTIDRIRLVKKDTTKKDNKREERYILMPPFKREIEEKLTKKYNEILSWIVNHTEPPTFSFEDGEETYSLISK